VLEKAEAHLKKLHGPAKGGRWIWTVSELSFFLNQTAISAGKLSLEKVRQELADFLKAENIPGIAYVFHAGDIPTRSLPPMQHERQILKTFYESRSGDVMMIPRPYYIVPYVTTTHMTGYAYDRTVPIILAGDAVVPGKYGEKVEVIDIAPTLSFLLGTIPPSGSEGRVMSESLKKN
jgi:hypothetical protein